jgi:hypothetical protein
MYFGATLRGTAQYWISVRSNLSAMVEQLGIPHIWFTLSAADTKWYDLHHLMPNGVPDSALPPTVQDKHRMQNICENPMLTSWFFCRRVELFIKNVLKPLFHVKDHWIRYEDQHRGSPHAHGLLWLSSWPDLKNLEGKSLEELENIGNFLGKLVRASNPFRGAVRPMIHPCQIPPCELKDTDEELGNLLNEVQLHSRCGPSCLRIEKKTRREVCRFHFPKELAEEAKLKLIGKDWEFQPKRDDPLLNGYNPIVSSAWQANTDFSALTSKHKVKTYITKYASKSEGSSEDFVQIFTNVANNLGNSTPAHTAIQQQYMKSLQRDISSQEVARHNMGEKMYTCTRSFKKLFLYPGANLRQVCQQQAGDSSDRSVTTKDTIAKYMTRPINSELDGISLLHFTMWYEWSQATKSWKKRSLGHELIVNVIPKLPIDVKSENYCRQWLLLNIPFRSESDLTSETEGSWINAMKFHVPQTGLSVSPSASGDEEFEDFEVGERDEQQLQWMTAVGMAPGTILHDPHTGKNLGEREMDIKNDWHQFARSLPSEAHTAAFLNSVKQDSLPTNAQEITITKETLNDKQREAADLFDQHLQCTIQKIPVKPLHLFIVGIAGSFRVSFYFT